MSSWLVQGYGRFYLKLFWIALAIGLLTVSQVARASVGGMISGFVYDSTGAIVPDAQVIAVNTQTGVECKVATDAKGFYALPSLPVGEFALTVHKTGFSDYRQTGLVIDINTALRADVTLHVGGVTQSVTVSTSGVHVETSSTQMGEVIGGTKSATSEVH